VTVVAALVFSAAIDIAGRDQTRIQAIGRAR